jgi:hypothetical protein
MKYMPAVALALGLATLTAEVSPAAAAMMTPRVDVIAHANPAVEQVYWHRHWHHWHHRHYWHRHDWHHHGYGY